MADSNNLQINVGADVSGIVSGMATAEAATNDFGDSITTLTNRLDALKERRLTITDIGQLAIINREINTLADGIQRIKNIGTAGFDEFGEALPVIKTELDAVTKSTYGWSGAIGQQKIVFTDIARSIAGGGLNIRSFSSALGIIGPIGAAAAFGIYELVKALDLQTDAEKHASEEAKKLKEFITALKTPGNVSLEAAGSEQGTLAKVQALTAIIEDQTKSYKERNNALLELKEINKNYFGDLTVETATIKTLTERVNEYSNALITEAIIKKQADKIADSTIQLQEQINKERELKDARDRARASLKDANTGDIVSGGTGGGITLASNNQQDAIKKVAETTEAFEKQQDVVLRLRESITGYRGELDKAVEEQVQQKPLQAFHSPDELKSLQGILDKIIQIKAEIAKPDERPLQARERVALDPDLTKVYTTKISEAIVEGNKIGTADSKKYAAELAGLYANLLSKLQNPDLHSPIQGIVDVKADEGQELESKIEKAFGKKEIDLKIPANIELELSQQINALSISDNLKKKLEEGFKNHPEQVFFYLNATPKVKLNLQKGIIDKQTLKEINEQISKDIQSISAQFGASIGETLGSAITNGLQGKNIFGGFVKILGDGIKGIGEYLIKISPLIEAIQIALKSLNPALMLPAGIALVAIGAAIDSTASKGFSAFADGGIVTGPTMGLVGEAGPEVIFPLEKLNKFVKGIQGGGGQKVVVTGQLQGQSLLLLQQRATKYNSMI